jgi:hypothetical protein
MQIRFAGTFAKGDSEKESETVCNNKHVAAFEIIRERGFGKMDEIKEQVIAEE